MAANTGTTNQRLPLPFAKAAKGSGTEPLMFLSLLANRRLWRPAEAFHHLAGDSRGKQFWFVSDY
jgi:hypothetical protein